MWGWNNEGQMGLSEDQKVVAVPTFVDFRDSDGKIVDLRIVKVQCTSSCTVCLTGRWTVLTDFFNTREAKVAHRLNKFIDFFYTDDGKLWGCGSNKYGQLGQQTKKLSGRKSFGKMPIDLDGKCVKDIKCRARGTLIVSSLNDSGGQSKN